MKQFKQKTPSIFINLLFLSTSLFADYSTDLSYFLSFGSSFSSDPGYKTLWSTSSNNEDVVIPTNPDYTYDYYIDCDNDGSADQHATGDATCTYASSGDHTIVIKGTFPAIYINNGASKDKIKEVKDWGSGAHGIEWKSFHNSYLGAVNLNVTASNTPDLSNTTDMTAAFKGTNLSTFDNVNNWDVSTIEKMDSMFANSNFNQDISNWDVSNVQSMANMFQEATSFNQNINNWHVNSLTTTSYMFANETVYNQDMSSWNVSNVDSMAHMFDGATAFNQDISNWDVSSVTNMQYMFANETAFNQDIGNWDVGSVKYMQYMFDGATAFNQDVSDWNVVEATDMTDILKDSDFSKDNYDLLLNQWSTLSLKSNVTFGVGDTQYTCVLSKTAHKKLVDDYSWNITDGGPDSDCGGSNIVAVPISSKEYILLLLLILFIGIRQSSRSSLN